MFQRIRIHHSRVNARLALALDRPPVHEAPARLAEVELDLFLAPHVFPSRTTLLPLYIDLGSVVVYPCGAIPSANGALAFIDEFGCAWYFHSDGTAVTSSFDWRG